MIESFKTLGKKRNTKYENNRMQPRSQFFKLRQISPQSFNRF